MNRIQLDAEYGQLLVKYDTKNEWKKNKLLPLKLNWNNSSSCYQTSVNRLKEVLNHIKAIGGYVKLSPRLQSSENLNEFGQTELEAQEEIDLWKNHHSFASHPSDSFDASRIGFKESFIPIPFQLAGIELIEKMNGRVILADEMGLGKTLQIAGVIGLYRDDLPAVIPSPVSVLNNWKTELLKALDFLDPDDISLMDEGTDKPSGLIVICTYRYLLKNKDAIKDFLNVRGLLLPDEAHIARATNTQVGATLTELGLFAKHYIPITGTPILHYIKEIYNLLLGIDPIKWSDKIAFESRYCEGHYRTTMTAVGPQRIWWANGSSNVNELMMILRENYMVRRLKHEVLDQLPKKQRITITLNITKQDTKFDEFINRLKLISKPILLKNNFSVSQSMQEIRVSLGEEYEEEKEFPANTSEKDLYKKDPIFKLYIDCGLAKAKNVAEYIQDSLDANPDWKFVLFFQHIVVYEKLKEILSAKFPQFGSITIYGKSTAKQRESEKQRYQTDEDCRFAYLSIEAAYAGITVTAGNVVGLVQLPWSPRIALQCEGRIDRIGQLREMLMLYFISANKFESAQLSMLLNKDDTIRSVLDGHRGKKFTTDSDNSTENNSGEFQSNDAFSALIEIISNELKEEEEEKENTIMFNK